MTNNITLAFINIDPPDPVNIMLEPKQETTDFMLAETYKLLILRIMTTKVKSMENIYPPAHVKGYQPTEAFEEKKTECLKKSEFYNPQKIMRQLDLILGHKKRYPFCVFLRPLDGAIRLSHQGDNTSCE